LRAAGVALSLSLSLLAGCTAPMVAPAPDAAGPAALAPADTTTAPAAQPVAPAMPAPAATTATTLTGTASFRGELLSGYAVQVLDAQTGEPVALKDDLAGATGLAVLNKNLVTDAKGQFSLQVVGLTAGQALLVVATKNNVRVEAVVTSNMQSLGAKGYTIAQAGTGFTLTELTTAIAKVARGVLNASQVLTPEAAAPVIAKLATQMGALSAKFETALTSNPNFANELIGAQGADVDAAVETLVGNAGQLADLTTAIAGLVGDIAKAAKAGTSPAAAEAAVKARLAKIEFVGTVLAGAFANNGFTLTNGVNGKSIDATAADFGTVTSQVTRPSSGGNATVVGYPVGTYDEFMVALYETNEPVIRLTADIRIEQSVDNYRLMVVPIEILPSLATLRINRDVVIDGGPNKFKLEASGISLYSRAITLKNLTVPSYIQTAYDTMSRYRTLSMPPSSAVTLDNVAMTSGEPLYLQGAGRFTVRNCQFGPDEALKGSQGIVLAEGLEASVVTTGNQFRNLYRGILIRSIPASLRINGARFTDCYTGIALETYASNNLAVNNLFGIAGNYFVTESPDNTGIRVSFYTDAPNQSDIMAKLEELNPLSNFTGYADGYEFATQDMGPSQEQ
jgi:hypothetical protein